MEMLLWECCYGSVAMGMLLWECCCGDVSTLPNVKGVATSIPPNWRKPVSNTHVFSFGG